MDILHACAVAPAAVGTCCVAADRGRARATELAASVLMTVTMLDAAVFRVVPAVWTACVLIAAAMAYAATMRLRRADHDPADDGAKTAHTGVGLVVMAALVVIAAVPAGVAEAGHHSHGSGAAIVLALILGYGGASVLLGRRAAGLERAQYVTMGAATVLMGVAALL